MSKRTMIPVFAVLLLAAFPGAASAVWTHGTVPLSDDNFEVTGTVKFDSGFLGSIECQTKAEVVLQPNSTTGYTTDLAVDSQEANAVTSKCSTGGTLAACQAHSFEPTGLPWIIHTDSSKITITGDAIDYSLTGGFCPTSKAQMTPASITATPDDTHAMTKLTLSGTAQVHVSSAGSGATTLSGSQTILEPYSGFYGLT